MEWTRRRKKVPLRMLPLLPCLSNNIGKNEKKRMEMRKRRRKILKIRPPPLVRLLNGKLLNNLRFPLQTKRNIRRSVISKRPNYSFPPPPQPYMIQQWIQNISAHVKAYPGTRDCTAAYSKVATTGLK